MKKRKAILIFTEKKQTTESRYLEDWRGFEYSSIRAIRYIAIYDFDDESTFVHTKTRRWKIARRLDLYIYHINI